MTKDELILRKVELEKELIEVNTELSKCELTNGEWFQYGVKNHYPYLTRLSAELREVIDTVGWDRYETITLENVIDRYGDDFEENDPRYDDLYDLLQRDNFGSVCCDW